MLQNEKGMARIINRSVYNEEIEDKGMTICIGAICDNAQKIVIASDRMITASYPSIEFEHALPKIEILSPRCVALTAGSALAHTELFKVVKGHITSLSNPSVNLITEKVKESFVEQRMNKANEKILKPRGLDIKTFYRVQAQLPHDVFLKLDYQIEKMNLGLVILICGVDLDGCHLHYIRDPGVSECFDALGYCSIGSGDIHATSNFIFRELSALTPLNEAIYTVYEGKRLAEHAPGVGKITDMLILDAKGITRFDDNDFTILKSIYKDTKEFELKRRSPEKFEELAKLSVLKNEVPLRMGVSEGRGI
jgi:hypothetical protein